MATSFTIGKFWRFVNKEYFLVILVFLLFSCLYAHSIVFDLSKVAGEGDYYQFLWNFWWIRTSVESFQLPFFTDLEYHPTGANLAFHTFSYHWAILSIPFQHLFSLVFILNSFYIVSFVATGISTYRLLSYLKCSRYASFIGSFVFTFCIHRIDRFHYYEIDSLGTMYIPLFIYFFFRIYDLIQEDKRKGQIKYSLLAGTALALTFLCSWYNGLFLLILAMILFCYKTMRTRRFPLRNLSVLGGTFLIVVAPFVIPMIAAYYSGDFAPRSHESVIMSSEYNNADLLSYFVPNKSTASLFFTSLDSLGISGPLNWVQGINSSFYGNQHEKGLFLGYTVIFLLIMSFRVIAKTQDQERRSTLKLLYVVFMVFFILSLGPTLYVLGERSIALTPYRILMKIPLLNVSRTPSRMGLIVILCSGIIAAITIDYYREVFKAKTKYVHLGMALLLVLIVIETFPGETHQVRDISSVKSDFFSKLNTGGERKVLLNVPVDFLGARGGGGEYLFHQTIHQQKIVSGYVAREPDYIKSTLNSSPFLQSVHHRGYEKDRNKKRLTLDTISDNEILKSVNSLSVDYIVLHKSRLNDQFGEIDARFSNVYGPSTFEDRRIKVYDTAGAVSPEEDLLYWLAFDKPVGQFRGQFNVELSYHGAGENRTLNVEATNHDPHFSLPDFDLPQNRPMMLVLDISCPTQTEFQVFYSTNKGGKYTEEESIKRPLKKGWNKLSLVLSGRKYTGRIRIDPGRVKGRYLLRSIKVIGMD